jgi:N-acetylmuramoyl-L-alanine amidase
MKAQESKDVAVSIQRALYRNIREVNRDVSDWGVKSAPFMVLLGVDAPAVLAEIAVLSNRAEEQKLGSAEYREMLAAFLEEGIAQYLMRRASSVPSALIAATPTNMAKKKS